MRELCGSDEKSTNERFITKGATAHEGRSATLYRYNLEAHVYGLRRVGEQSDRNEVNAGLGVSSNIFHPDPSRALERNAVLQR